MMLKEQNGSDYRAGDPERRRTRRRRGLIATAVVLVAILVAIGGYIGWALNAELPEPIATMETPEAVAPAPVTLALPTDGASAISISGADAFLGATASGIWAASGTDEPRSIASISKLITALVILDELPLDSADAPGPTITFDEAAHDLYDEYYVLDATVAEMPIGSSMSLHDAIATMLIPSASNYAEAVSTWAFGSQSAFVFAAEEWLAANGLTSTTIVEPTGLDPRNTSTPGDLITLGKLAAANPAIAQIVATPSLSLDGPGDIYTTNELLGTDGITGLKTGNLGEGSYNLLYTANLDVGLPEPLSVTGVMLGGFSEGALGSDVLALFDSIRSGFHWVELMSSGHEIGSYVTAWGETAQLVVGESASILTWSDTPIVTTLETTTPTTYEDGEVVGEITWTSGPNTTTAEVKLQGSIDPPTDQWRLSNPGELG